MDILTDSAAQLFPSGLGFSLLSTALTPSHQIGLTGRALPDDEAIAILSERRGSYNPLVVDAFIGIHRDLVKLASEPEDSIRDRSLFGSTLNRAEPRPTASPPHFESISASTEETLTLYSLAQELSRSRTVDDLMQNIAAHIRRMVPVSTFVFFRYDASSDTLSVSDALGESSEHFLGLSIKRGERLSGWVAANLRTIVNSDPVLDLGEAGRAMKPRLCSCLSTPLTENDQLIGVLSLYANQRDLFTEDHRRAIEAVARCAGDVLARLLALESSAYNSESLGISRRQLRSLVRERLERGSNEAPTLLAVVYVVERSASATAEKLESLREALSTELRTDDLCFVYSDTELCVLRIGGQEVLSSGAFQLELHSNVDRASAALNLKDCRFSVSIAAENRGQATLDELVRAARTPASTADDASGPGSSVH